MDKNSFIVKKVENSFVVWFKNCNLFFQLEEPAYFVFDKLVAGASNELIASDFSERYLMDFNESLTFVNELNQKIDELIQPQNNVEFIHSENITFKKPLTEIFSQRAYKLFNNVILFNYETEWLEGFMHPMISQFKITEKANDYSHFIELFISRNKVVLYVDDKFIGNWEKDESEFVKGRIFLELANIFHQKKEDEWLMTVHASAVCNNKKTILFSASPGSGKTTFAAMLQNNGYKVISDDFVPVDKIHFNAHPMPFSMSVKEGSLKLLEQHYPDLEKRPMVTLPNGKKIKYLPLKPNIDGLVCRVGAYVFIKYDEAVDFHIEKLMSVDAIRKILKEAWIPISPDNIEAFLDRVIETSFYNLTYSNLQKATNAIDELFNT